MQGLVNFYSNILAGHRARPLSVKYFENYMVKICREKSLFNNIAFVFDFQPLLARKIISNFLLGAGGEWEFQKRFFS